MKYTMVPSTAGYRGLRVATGEVVMCCMLPLESRAWNITVTVHSAGFAFEMLTRQTLPCRSPAYTRVEFWVSWPLEFTAMTVERPFATLRLQAVGTAAQRSILVVCEPFCGLTA